MQSLVARRYYAHPQNQFWRLIAAVIGRDIAGLAYGGRLTALLDAKVGLWDVVASAHRLGSGDAEIRNHSSHDIAGLVRQLPSLRAVAFNGQKATLIGMKLMQGQDRVALVRLPSSSPAYTIPFEDKRAEWLKLRDFLV